MTALLTIGQLARRTGMSVSAIRYYEGRGLLSPIRTSGNQRRFLRSDLRRLSFVIAAQRLGLSVREIEAELSSLPAGRAPTAEDWTKISSHIADRLNAQIAFLERMRDRLDQCIGCGCLSMERCALYNADDRAAAGGPGPRFLFGQPPG